MYDKNYGHDEEPTGIKVPQTVDIGMLSGTYDMDGYHKAQIYTESKLAEYREYIRQIGQLEGERDAKTRILETITAQLREAVLEVTDNPSADKYILQDPEAMIKRLVQMVLQARVRDNSDI